MNGEYLAQTVAIARYLAGEFKLNGSDLWDSAKCDEIADGAQDFGLCKLIYHCVFIKCS